MAIIGLGCRFPGGVEDAQSFWDLLASGTDAIVDVPADRWNIDDHFDADPATPGRMLVRQGGFLDAPVDRFDAAFFGIPPRDAAAMDPQQRLLLEVTWEAFEDAGIAPEATAGASVGTYVGGFTFDAQALQVAESNRSLINAVTAQGTSPTMLSARLAYTFDWHGPCFTVDTACSSSLVAVHQACAAIARGECDLAVAAGVNVMTYPVATVMMSKGHLLSPDARCKSFDARANGYVRGEGAGVVLLKPLTAAIRDGDRIHAVIRGTAVNQDGRTPGISVPNGTAQQAVIRQACQSAGVEPRSLGYFEAHGTGTAVGDPIEAGAIGAVLADSDRKHWLGSVKSSIGHTEAAAGVAALIKATLCLERGLIPANLHFEQPNPRIPFDDLSLRVPTRTVPFDDANGVDGADGMRRAGVNSFGFGGTNAHAVLEQAPPAGGTGADEIIGSGPVLLPLSVRSPTALPALAAAYAKALENPEGPGFARISRAASRGREHHPVRAFVVAHDPTEAIEKLRRLEPTGTRRAGSGTVFVYTGMGPQWWAMGRELLAEEPRFAEVVRQCDEVLSRFGLSMAEELRREEADSRLSQTLYAQVANFVVQAGLTAIWRDWGIEPIAVVGHSVGEVAAAYVAGVYSLEDALTISFHRAGLQARLTGRGAMLAVGLPVREVRPYLTEGVSVAAVNSSTATTLAGDPPALEALARKLRADGISAKALRVEVAYHSHQMDEIQEPLLTALAGLQPRSADLPLFSTVTGGQVEGQELDAGYWWQNVRRPVRFADALQRVLALTPGAVLEVGPHPVLAAAIDEGLTEKGQTVTVLASLHRDRPQREQMLETLGALYVTGARPDWERVHPGPREHLDLPHYPWQRERHWVESPTSRSARLGDGGLRMAGRAVSAPLPTRDLPLSPARFPYLADHRIGPTVVFPGSAYLETALALFPDDETVVLEDVVFQRKLPLEPGSVTTLRATLDPQQRTIMLDSRSGDDEPWTHNVRMRCPELIRPEPPQPTADTLVDLTRSLTEISHDEVYARLDRTTLGYGGAFRAVRRLWVRDATSEVFAELDVDTVDSRGYRIHPALLDAALHAMSAGALTGSDGIEPGTYVPARLDRLRFFRSPGRRLWVQGRLTGDSGHAQIAFDLTLFTDGGEVVAEVTGLRAMRLATAVDKGTPSEDLYYEHVWHPRSLPEVGDVKGVWVVIGSTEAGEAARLAQGLNGRGAEVVSLEPEGNWLERFTATIEKHPGCRAVVWAAGSKPDAAAACASVAVPLMLAQALQRRPVPLVLVTTGAQSVSGQDPTTDPFAASVWGFGRVVAAEQPDLRCRLIDVSPALRSADPLLDELTHEGLDEVALRKDGRFVRRLQRADARSRSHHLQVSTATTPVRLRSTGPSPEKLGFVAETSREPGPTEVEIDVSHVGLNFKDVLKLRGALSREATQGSVSQDTLGVECSGVVVRVGSRVPGLRAGDEVIAHAGDLFGSRVTVDQRRVIKKPPALSFAQAASLLPAVTSYVSLTRIARLEPGERVLIHSAAGGVGLAAVRIATWLGAEVYATAGSEQRRAYLRDQGVARVTDSRTIGFVDDVLAWTDGEGVDVVLSSQPGEIRHQSIGLLRPLGRFVELGKAGIADGLHLALARFHRSLAFHAFDYDQVLSVRPELFERWMGDLTALYQEGAFAPLPVTEFRPGDVASAFRTMTGPEHIGKIAVRMAGESVTVPAYSIPQTPIRPDGTYLITGGLGGLGLEVARWLADQGARHLVLVGRSGISSTAAETAVAELTGRGVDIQVEKADVSRRKDLASVLNRTRTQSPPIRGIIHAAADFDDAVLSATDPSRMITATGAKADGAWNLHVETENDDLDLFVLFSSLAAQIGAIGAGAYTTANEFLNGLARYRRAQGRPSTSIGWGMIADVGVALHQDGVVGAVLVHNGHVGLPPGRLVAELGTVLRTKPVEISVADIDWPMWGSVNPQLAALPRFSTLFPAGWEPGGAPVSVMQQLTDASPGERAAMLPGLLAPLLRRVTGLSDEDLAAQQAVDIDSLTGVELRTLLQNSLGVSVPAVRLQQNLTLDGLAGMLSVELDRMAPGTADLVDDFVVHQVTTPDGLVIHGHLTCPSGPGPHPVVVVCTSGRGGALDGAGRYARVGEHGPLRAAGFAVFTVDQRGARGYGKAFEDLAELGGLEIDDVVTAARYLAALPEIDATRMSILGTSRGGYSALMSLIREPSLWHRAVLLMPLADPTLLIGNERVWLERMVPQRPDVQPAEVKAHLLDPERQPLLQLEAVRTPVLTVHGDADDVLPPEGSTRLVDGLRRIGRSATLLTVPGLGHDSEHADSAWSDLWPVIAGFLGERPGDVADRRAT